MRNLQFIVVTNCHHVHVPYSDMIKQLSFLSRFFSRFAGWANHHASFFTFGLPLFCPPAILLLDGVICRHERIWTSAFRTLPEADRVLGRSVSTAWRYFFFAQEENEEVRRQIARLKKKNRDEGSRARASRPNFHCILETAGYYEHEMFLLFPSPFSPISVFLPRLRLVSCLSPLVSLYVFWQILMVHWSWECKIRERIVSLSSNNLYMSRGNQIALECLDLTC